MGFFLPSASFEILRLNYTLLTLDFEISCVQYVILKIVIASQYQSIILLLTMLTVYNVYLLWIVSEFVKGPSWWYGS